MKNKGLTYILLLLLCPFAFGQVKDPVLLSTTGSFVSNNDYSVSYSVGELSVTSEISGPYFLTQGFQQFYLNSAPITPPCETGNCPELIKIYPNPVRNKLNVQFFKLGQSNFTLDIYNFKGGKVLQKKYPGIGYGAKEEISFDDIPKGIYVIYVSSDDGKLLDKFKIVKI